MRRIYLFLGIVCGVVFEMSPLHAQGFTPSKTYEQITVDYYKALALPLQSTAGEHVYRTHKYMWGVSRPAAQYQYTAVATTQPRQTKAMVVNLSPWKGKVEHLDDALAAPTPSIRRMTGIGSAGGGTGLPENPNGDNNGNSGNLGEIGGGTGGLPGAANGEHNLPIGDIPMWLLVLLAGAYTYRLRRSNSA